MWVERAKVLLELLEQIGVTWVNNGLHKTMPLDEYASALHALPNDVVDDLQMCAEHGVRDAYTGDSPSVDNLAYYEHGSKTPYSDLDATFVVKDVQVISRLQEAIQRSSSLWAHRYEMNVYVEPPEEIVMKLISDMSESDVALCARLIGLKGCRSADPRLCSPGKLTPREQKMVVEYQQYQTAVRGGGTGNWKRTQARYYRHYFNAARTFFREASVANLAHMHFMKYDGYVCVCALVSFLNPSVKLSDAQHQLAIRENALDAYTNMHLAPYNNSANYLGKTKYLARMCRSLKSVLGREECAQEDYVVGTTCLAISMIYDDLRKYSRVLDLVVWNSRVVSLCRMMIRLILPGAGKDFNIEMLSHPMELVHTEREWGVMREELLQVVYTDSSATSTPSTVKKRRR